MGSPVLQYTDEIHEKFAYWATWFPNAKLALGDCGPIKGRVFEPEVGLSRFDITFDETTAGPAADFEYASQGSVSYQVQLSVGNAVIPHIPQGKAGIEVTFARENGIVFVVKEGRQRRIDDIRALRATLLDRALQGDFPRDYAVVTHVVEAGATTVLISSGGDSRFAASAEADLRAGLLDLANLEAGLTRVSSERLETEFFVQTALTPMFKLAGFKKGGLFWGKPSFDRLQFDGDADPGDLDELVPGDADPS